MNRALRKVLPLLLIAIAAIAIAGCSSEEHHEVPEGEPIEVSGVRYNVMISRYLNPDLVDDASYLGEDAVWPGADKLLLGVFVQVNNHSGETITIPEDLVVIDTRDRHYYPKLVDTDFALELGTQLEDGVTLPLVDSPPFYGPIQGSLILYELGAASVENRPLRLEIPAHDESGEHGYIRLDI